MVYLTFVSGSLHYSCVSCISDPVSLKYLHSKVHGANMGPTWVLSTPDGPHVGPMNFAIRIVFRDMG